MNTANPLSEKYYGFYRGVVLKNCDPSNRGRVKIYLPSFGRQIVSKQNNEEYNNWCLKYPGDGIVGGEGSGGDFSKIADDELNKLADVLDWVDQASPLVGCGTINLHHASKKKSSISDSPKTFENDANENSPRAYALSKDKNTLSGGTDKVKGGKVDVDAYNRKAPDYNNSAKGVFSIPRVGAHVWVFFEGGDISRPVYFAYSYSQAEWKSVQVQNLENPELHSPTSVLRENDPQGGDLYTGKTVWVEKGGVLEFINTDDFESVRVADHKGSHVTLDKHGITISTAPSRTRKDETFGDHYEDVLGDQILRVNADRQVIVEGDEVRVHGKLANVELQKQWLEAAASTFQNAANRITPPLFTKKCIELHASYKKSAPNNIFNMTVSLKFKSKGDFYMLQTQTRYLYKRAFAPRHADLIIDRISLIPITVVPVVTSPALFMTATLQDCARFAGVIYRGITGKV